MSETHDVSAAVNTSQISENENAERTQLILDHLPQVKLIARNISKRLPLSANLDDLISAGVIGLIAAVDAYDHKRGVKLKTYADYKIRGAILDSLRDLDWASRGSRRRSQRIERVMATLEQELKRAPVEEEIARALVISVHKYRNWLLEASNLTVLRLENARTEDEGGDLLCYLTDSEKRCPSQLLERADLERHLAKAIEQIPATEKTVLRLYYQEELTLREIAKILSLHESRISQMKSQATLRLRSLMDRSAERSRRVRRSRLGTADRKFGSAASNP
ncbi:MAG: FliA/WhiG family RNA polymerase sigma factor [Acidobacteriota bacterium]|nr:FliA/WhiG family RNA polymerase sigma factor [Acidobacteriota bacterium]